MLKVSVVTPTWNRADLLVRTIDKIQSQTIPQDLYENPTFYFPSAISDTAAVSGTALFRLQRQSLPFLWSGGGGVQFLPLPCGGPPPSVTGGPSTPCSGSTTGVSATGTFVAGQVLDVHFREGALVKRGDLLITSSATGTVEPIEVIDVGAQVAEELASEEAGLAREVEDASALEHAARDRHAAGPS